MREPAPFVTRFRSRTLANGDSIRFDLRRCNQCSAGIAKNASSASWSSYQAAGRLGILRLELGNEGTDGRLRVGARRRIHDLAQRPFRPRPKAHGQFVEYVGHLVAPVALRRRLRPDVAHRRPEAQRAVADRHHRRPESPPAQVPQHARPALRTLPISRPRWPPAPWCRPTAPRASPACTAGRLPGGC